MAVKKYRKIPIEVRAIQYDRNNLEEVKAFAGDALVMRESLPTVKSLEGEETLNVGDYVVRNPGGDRYRKKPVLQDAIRFTGDNFPEIAEFGATVTPPRTAFDYDVSAGTCKIPHPGFPAPYTAHVGDYIIRNGNSVYPCAPDVFEATYEPLGEDAP